NRLDGVERAMYGLANGLEALGADWPDAAPVFSREQMRRIAEGHHQLRALRESAVRPPFVPGTAEAAYTLSLGRLEQAEDEHWVIPLAMPFDVGADGMPRRWLLAELNAEAF